MVAADQRYPSVLSVGSGIQYTGKDRRHRYAEKIREELERLREKKDQAIVYSS